MSTPVKTTTSVAIENIIRDVRERGDQARRRVVRAPRATKSPKPERAVAYGDIPTAAVLDAAQSVRTWHEPASARQS